MKTKCIELPPKLKKRLDEERKELKLKTREELIIYILKNYYGI